jgi:hypothetical protein
MMAGNPGNLKPELIFSELQPERIFPALTYEITAELVDRYMETVGDRNPLYLSMPNKNPSLRLAPPGLAAIYARLSYLRDYTMPTGGVLAKQEFFFKKEVFIEDRLTVIAKVEESFLDEKKRKRVTFLIQASNQRGEPVSEIHLYAIWPK